MVASQAISVDFRNADESEVFRLITAGTLRDLETYRIELKEGLELRITGGEISAAAVVQRRDGMWVAKVTSWE